MSEKHGQDIELGQSALPHPKPNSIIRSSTEWLHSLCRKEQADKVQGLQIEDYPQGYPRYSALIAADSCLHVFRRFSAARTRLLLLKQDKISVLEQQLDKVDKEEQAPLFLGNCRLDKNVERQRILQELDAAVEDYDSMLMRNSAVLSYAPAKARHIRSLQNWTNGNGCLGRKEAAYLTHTKELMSLTSSHDGACERLEDWIDDQLIHVCDIFRKFGPSRNVSRDPYVYIFSGRLKRQIARWILASTVVVFLLAPMLICNAVERTVLRVVVIVTATVLLISLLAFMIRARTVEMFVAGTAYATVLVVFISGTPRN